jgi:hypothetical protein
LIATMPAPAASLTALPDMLDMTTFISTVTWPRPARVRPATASAAAQMRSEMVAAFITFPARMNIGIARSTPS